MSTNEVIVLFNGYSKVDPDDSNYMLANCTCTLIKGRDGYNVIVDTMTPWDGPRIIEALKSHSLVPEDINAVVSTHGHSDHTGNNNLFLNAEWHIVGQCASRKDQYLMRDPWSPFQLTPDIHVIATPGHTLTCVSVVVRNTNLGSEVVVCGDLFEKTEDILNPSIWIEAGSENQSLQRENRFEISRTANWIIPGHGKSFQVTPQIREKLEKQFKEQ